MRSLRWVCSVVLLSLSVSPVFCQSPTGVLPFESFSGDQFESVNVANLNLHVAIPFVKRAGRGIPFFYGLVYDSQIWAPTSGHWTGAPNLAFLGWRGATSGNFGGASYVERALNCGLNGGDRFTWTSVTDGFGVSH